ncbi:ribonuclease E inhibitor RraB [Lysobacter niastensis]|uniref:Ribonuclease E inhibitor RraB n=1 Tax=Lysobacter niastensis TaxID=380629 RepID=A0ABS0B9S2_9GAMM|nr:ribonuclease E inhibitor RraB [Lysobacter niastensis]MBF6023865.1 ribonuclease E inhibitor RraB [Lysobacter niastensis]
MRELRLAMIPDDENGQVLRQMVEDGDDLSVERGIEFFHVFADEARARAFAEAASALPALAIGAPEVDEEGIWQVVAVRVMAPSHAGITALEKQLVALAGDHGGYPDGWACPTAGDAADDADEADDAR